MRLSQIKTHLSLHGVVALARLANIHHSNLSRILNGKANPSWASAKRICAAAGISLDDLDRYIRGQRRAL